MVKISNCEVISPFNLNIVIIFLSSSKSWDKFNLKSPIEQPKFYHWAQA